MTTIERHNPVNKFMSLINAYRVTPDGSLPLTIQVSSIDELTHQLPAGFYTTFRTYNGGKSVLGLKAHLQRLYQPASTLESAPVVSSEVLRRQLANVLNEYPDEARVRLVLTKDGEIYIALTALSSLSPEIYNHGVKVITSEVQRESPRLKSTAFIAASQNVRSQIARSEEVFEALLMQDDAILEGMTSNFFYVREGVLGTAQKDILLGVTRRTVIRVIRGSGFSVVYRPLKRKQFPALSEAFLTSSSRGIVPITQIDDTPVGEGIPGQITKKLMSGYQDYVMNHAELIYGG
jgi:branched-chain amino acid aminotransferase